MFKQVQPSKTYVVLFDKLTKKAYPYDEMYTEWSHPKNVRNWELLFRSTSMRKAVYWWRNYYNHKPLSVRFKCTI